MGKASCPVCISLSLSLSVWVCIYINYTFYYTNDLCFLDELNRLVIDKNKLLICGDYTGRSNSIMENHFIDLYESEQKYNYGYLTNMW